MTIKQEPTEIHAIGESARWLDENGFVVSRATVDILWDFVYTNIQAILSGYVEEIEEIVSKRKES